MNDNISAPENNSAPGPQIVPHSREAEEAVIGSVLINPEAYYDVAQFLEADDFYIHRHRWVWETFQQLHERRIPIDFLTVSEELDQRNQLAEIGGPAYLTSLINNVPTSLHAEAYGRIVEETSIRRRMLAAANDIAKLAYQEDASIDAVMDGAEKSVFGVSERRMTRDLQSIQQVLSDYYDRIDQLASRGEDIYGVPTGFIDLDRMLGGLQPSDLLIIAGRPGTGKCVTADTRIVDPHSGELITIEELVQRRDAHLLTLSDRFKLEPAEASHFVDDGLKPVFRVKTALGREIKVTLSHPFLTIHGWRPLGDLAIGDRVAVPRLIPVFGSEDLPDYKVKILAYLLADGNVTEMSPRFTNSNPLLREDFATAALNFPGVRAHLKDMHGQRTPTVYIVSDLDQVKIGRKAFANQLTQAMQRDAWSRTRLAAAVGVSPALVTRWKSGKCAPSSKTFKQLCEVFGVPAEEMASDGLAAMSWKGPNSLRLWLQELGVWGKAAAEKDIPDCVYRLNRPKLALFLNRLFACDGSISSQGRDRFDISYSTVSSKLAHAVQHLLLRFGVIARLRQRRVKYRDSRRVAYELVITGVTNTLLFIEQIGAFGKEQAIDQVRMQVADKAPNPNRDLLPPDIWDSIVLAKGERTWRSIYDVMGLPAKANIHVGKRAPSRQRLLAIGHALESDQLVDLAQSDVYWDQITSIEYLGERQVYDLTVPGTHNFVADDVIVHNTAFMISAAKNAAQVYKKHVAIFSLEMSNEQLVQRLIAQETGIDSQRLRTGKLNEDEWPVFTHAIEVLSDTRVFLDDTPALTPLQLRTKCRRLHLEFQLDLVVVDYLQLMSSGARSENRVQEVSYISRNMKILARELNVPVLAAAQLSRAVEQRADKEPQLSDLRESGCLAGDTLISLSSGELQPIASLAGLQPEVVTMDGWKITTGQASRVWLTGHRPVYRLKTASGRSIRATANHPFRELNGWQSLAELKVGNRIALPRKFLEPANPLGFAPSRDVLHSYGTLLNAPNLLEVAESDVFWDEVTEIEYDGEEDVYDMSVPDTHNFIANGFIVHNSLEQDADIVMFIHRPELYEKDTLKQNIAQIKVAKHRNGPVGTVELVFRSNLAKFENAATRRVNLSEVA